MEVNEKIKKYLEEHGITQAFLVDKTGIPHWALSNSLNNRRNLTASELGKIAKALNVSADIFLS